ncbi:MAG: DUF4250 domain-containing protein [Oscillospiraceae bacterium]|jgi:hypothetical protein|nr:DUF4250 domain-containing protein [Oscillospiraceae bacterium]MDD3260651.1 DUF4250 domain-containing protein [Oscillospiraceae bacterium]
MSLPNDPAILLSVVNARLRNNYPSLDELCHTLDVDQKALEEKLKSIDYVYDPSHNQFV